VAPTTGSKTGLLLLPCAARNALLAALSSQGAILASGPLIARLLQKHQQK